MVVEVGTLVLVRAGMGGNQIALVLRADKEGWRVRKFVATTHSWTQPTVVVADAVVGHPKPEDPRRGIATRLLTKEQLAEVAWTGRMASAEVQ
jgi:hypothetical protein